MRITTIAVAESHVRRRTDSKPWYRQFWPWFLVALPAVSVAVSAGVLYAALHDADPVVPHEGDSTSYAAPQAPAVARPGAPSGASAREAAP